MAEEGNCSKELNSRKRGHDTGADDIESEEEGPEYNTHNTKIIATHYNNLKNEGLAKRNQSNIYYMRNFNNWVKSMLIDRYGQKSRDGLKYGTPMKVLDMCCGKGGDLIKWKNLGIKHLVCCDIAELSVEECRERYENFKRNNVGFTMESFVCDSTVDWHRRFYKDPTVEFDLVSCQFAFHYCFESLPQAEQMLKNASECLKIGGFFIGTIPDAYQIMRRRKMNDANEFGNEIYEIVFECNPDDPPLFGAKYNFKLDGVVNCPEFLVHFPTLVRLAQKFGLELEEQTRFDHFFQQQLDKEKGSDHQRGSFLLEKMNALEIYPPRPNSRFKSKSEDNYSETSQRMRAENCKQVGTISKCEWDAISLYTVFAFKKVRKYEQN